MTRRNQNPIVVFSNNVTEIFPGETVILVADSNGHGGVWLKTAVGNSLDEALAELRELNEFIAENPPANPAHHSS
ncbi:hypothetical protein [Devosia faecipullorum]|uniref:hypothetical protein n=1 Tax=Devosia faecipullorum TaxID=2755039 RepID=UPI00187BA3DF|nr:hypothetical protein [Devosia faecipullorum]MBE7732159.1 hypothetical protein [Devosia faecipullorum]